MPIVKTCERCKINCSPAQRIFWVYNLGNYYSHMQTQFSLKGEDSNRQPPGHSPAQLRTKTFFLMSSSFGLINASKIYYLVE